MQSLSSKSHTVKLRTCCVLMACYLLSTSRMMEQAFWSHWRSQKLVVVKVPPLSAFGLVWDKMERFLNITRPIQVQVLLFLRHLAKELRILDIFLLQENITLKEAARQQKHTQHIKVSSNCHLSVGECYTVHCEPEDFKIQPVNLDQEMGVSQ